MGQTLLGVHGTEFGLDLVVGGVFGQGFFWLGLEGGGFSGVTATRRTYSFIFPMSCYVSHEHEE